MIPSFWAAATVKDEDFDSFISPFAYYVLGF
jgi:hypothetical protein